MFAREIHKVTFPFLYFSVTKSTKSHQRERSPLFENSSPVSATPTNALRALVHSPRARVSRASHAWQARAAKDRAKVGGFTAPRNRILPRVRTHHTRKPSRFVHALSARRIIGLAGVGLMCALTEVTISLLQREKVARFTAADEVLHVYCAKQILSHHVRAQTFAQI